MINQQIGQYRIIEKLGEGGMGVVYKAEDMKLGRMVALKFLPAELDQDPAAKQRLLREAQAASNLEHANICTIHDIAETPEGLAYIVMAYYEGINLRQEAQSRSLSVQETLNISLQIALGLQAAHDKGILHQDIKSANIMVTRTGHVKIMDFGIARQLERTQITSSDLRYGTLAYMSPEQARGHKLDKRTDIWSFGAVLYELTTGQLPFRANYDQALIYSILYEEPDPPCAINANIPKAFSDLIMRCLQKRPDDRYESLADIVKHILEITYEKGRRATLQRLLIKKVAFITSILCLLVMLVVGGGLLYRDSMVVPDTLLLQINEQSDAGQKHDRSLAAMVHYLISNQLRRADLKFYSDMKTLRMFYPGKLPFSTIDIDVRQEKIGYTITIERKIPWLWGWARRFDMEYRVNDHSVILMQTIPAIIKQIVPVHYHAQPFASLTSLWDAFEWFYQGELAWEKLNITRAKEAFSAAIQIDPDFALAKLQLARVYKFEASYKMARNVMLSIKDRLRSLSPIDSLRAQALLYWLDGNARKEIDLLRRIYDVSPLDVENAFEVAEAYYYISEVRDAMHFYDLVLSQDSSYARAYNHLGYCLSSLGDHDKALVHFRKYLSLDSTANAYDSLGDGYLAAGKLDSAVHAKELGINQDQKLSYLYYQLFFIRIMQGQLAEAERSAEAYGHLAITLDESVRGLYLKALVAFFRKDYNGVIRLARSAFAIYDAQDVTTRNHDLHWLYAVSCLALQKVNDASQEVCMMEKIINENQISAHNYRRGIYKYWLHLQAMLAARQGDVNGLLEIMKKMDAIPEKIKDVQTIFDYPFFCQSFADLLLQVKRPDLALDRLKQALALTPWNGFVHCRLWQEYRRRGNGEMAEKHFQLARRIWVGADEEWLNIYFKDQIERHTVAYIKAIKPN
jgi:serine/threonine protein kinase/Tfp pilus assembly protein PilF